MQYLIGEIGLLVLGAGFIGLLVGWLISRFFKSRSAAVGQRRLVDDIQRRDHEIRRLQGDLRHARNDSDEARVDYRRSRDERTSRSDERYREPQKHQSDYAVAAKAMRSETASLTVRGGANSSTSTSTSQASRRPAAPAGGQKKLASPPAGGRRPSSQDPSASRSSSRSGHNQSIRANADRAPSKENELRATVDNERHEKVQAFVAAGAREGELKKRLEEETYSKIQAFAKLGESERTLAETSKLATQSFTQTTVVNERNDTVLRDYQKLVDQKNLQVDQLQQKVRDLLALKQQVAPAPAPVRVPVVDGAAQERERVLKANLEEESFAKVQAIAALGEVEHKLKLSQTKPSVDPSLAPLRRRAEQQDAIILDLRKRIEIQQNQSNVMQQEFDRKVRSREADLATLKADFSGGKSDTSQAEIDSYRRKLAESDRAHQSRIAEFNKTLEARNHEYDELGNRLEELRGKIKLKDTQLGQLKTELEQQSAEKITLEAAGNKYREELGGLKISLEEKDANILSLKTQASDLERSGADVREVETQLSEFTRSTEASAQKFENVILEQRTKLAAREKELTALKAAGAKREAELEEQLVAIRNTAKDAESKKAALQADANRFQSQKNAHEAEISQLGKDIRAATASNEHSRKEIKRLEVLAKEAEILRKTVKDKEAEEQRLQQLLDAASKAKVAADLDNKKLLQAKDAEINKVSSDLSAVRKSVENEQSEVVRFKKEAQAEKANIAQLTKSFEEESKKQKDVIANLEPLRLKLHDSELAAEKLRKEHQVALAKSSQDVELVRAEMVKLEKTGSEGLVAKDKELADLRTKTKELHTLRSDLSQRDSKITTLSADLEKLRQQKGEYDNEIARLSKEIDVSKKEASTLKQSLEAEKQGLLAKNNELLKVQASAKDYEARLTTLTAESQTASDGNKEAVSELQGKLDAAYKTHQQEITSRDTQLGDLKHKLQALDTLRAENAKYADDIKALNLKLADESKAAELNRQEVSALKSAADEIRIARAKEKEALNAELREAKESAVQVESLRKQTDTYQTQIQGLKLQAQQESTQFQQRIKELEPWQQKFTLADQQARDHQASFVKLKADSSAELEHKLSLVKQQNQELLTQRDKRIADLDQKVQTLDKLQQDIALRDKKLSDLNTEIAQSRKQASEFESRFKTAEQQARSHEENLKTLKAEHSTKGSQYVTDAEHAKKEIAALISQQQSLESKHAETLKEHSASVDRMKLQIAESEKKVADTTSKLTAAKSDWEQETANLKKTHESKIATVQSDYEAQLDVQRSKSEKSTGALQSLQSKVAKLEPLQSKLSAAETETKRLQETSKAASDKHAAEIAAVQQRIKELEPLQARLASQEAEHKELLDQQKASAEKHASEVAALNSRVKEIEPLQLKLTTQETENKRLQESRKAAVEKSAAELGALQARVQEIEPLQRKLVAKETELNRVQESQRGGAEKASAEINSLLLRVTELEPLQQKLAAKDAEYKKLSLEHGATADKSTAEITALKARVQQLEPLQQKLSSQEVEYKKLQETEKAAADKASTDIASMQGRIRELEPLQQKLSAQEADYRKLQEAQKVAADKSAAEISALKAAAQEADSLQKKLAEQQSSYSSLQASHKQSEGKYSAELATLKARASQADTLERKLEAQEAEYKKLLAAQNAANQHGKAEVAPASAPAPAPGSAAKKAAVTADGKKTTRKDGMDDLKLIFGIGPKIETMLNDEGVNHFEDIANWKQGDIEHYSEMLVGFPDRIERDEWVLSAQQLIDGTYNWEEKRKARETTSAAATKADPVSNEAKASPTSGSSGRATRTVDGKKISRKDGMDDLKLIFGIGTKIEKMLNRKGVKTFEDIAAWNQDDIDRYSEMLEGFPDRIERDEWVQSAKEIIAGTYNWELRKQTRNAN